MQKLNYHLTNYCSGLCLATGLLLLGMTPSLRDPTQPLNFKPTAAQPNDTYRDFDVRAIFADDTNANPRVIIGCCLFNLGDEIAGYTVEDITHDGVTLKNSYGEEIFTTIGSDKIKYQTAPDEENNS